MHYNNWQIDISSKQWQTNEIHQTVKSVKESERDVKNYKYKHYCIFVYANGLNIHDAYVVQHNANRMQGAYLLCKQTIDSIIEHLLNKSKIYTQYAHMFELLGYHSIRICIHTETLLYVLI